MSDSTRFIVEVNGHPHEVGFTREVRSTYRGNNTDPDSVENIITVNLNDIFNALHFSDEKKLKSAIESHMSFFYSTYSDIYKGE